MLEEVVEEKEQLWEDIDGEAWLSYNPHKMHCTYSVAQWL